MPTAGKQKKVQIIDYLDLSILDIRLNYKKSIYRDKG
jgi:hypothetical protein